jgi:hypothetical protein
MEMSKEPCGMSEIPDHAPATVSIENQMPLDLFDAMREFIRCHPQWDQYRLMQAALAGFLFQQGCQDRAVARHYLDGLFRRDPKSGVTDASEVDASQSRRWKRGRCKSASRERPLPITRADKPESRSFPSWKSSQPPASRSGE